MGEMDPLNPRQWKGELERVWREIPKVFRNEHTVRGTLRCHLYGMLKQQGFSVVADYKPPRMAERPVDLIAVDDGGKIVCAVCFDTLVTLHAVKSLTSFECRRRVIFTTGMLEKKVKESRFFLKPEVEHVHLKPFGDR